MVLRYHWKDYGPLHALADVSFSIAEGEVFGLLGRNGSGKTTLLRILTGYRLPTAGSVRVAGIDLVRQSVRDHSGVELEAEVDIW